MNRLNEPTIIFRCDGGSLPETGTGHIRRCLNLALLLREKYGINSRFLTRDLDGRPPDALYYRFPVHLIPPVPNWEKTAMRIVQRIDPSLVVVDLLDKGSSFLETLSIETPEIPTITMDDTGMGLDFATCSINSILEHPKATYNGPDYLILSSGVTEVDEPQKKVEEIFLCFGGYDHNDLTVKVLEAVTVLKRRFKVTVLVGRAFLNEEVLISITENKNVERVDIIKETSNIAYLLKKADIGIVSGGLTLYEAMNCGLPVMVLSQYEHQAITAARFHKAKAVIDLGLGSKVVESRLVAELENLCDDYRSRLSLSSKAASLVDGKGINRVAEIINNMVTEKTKKLQSFIPLHDKIGV
ncbi:MAG: hypothetical protein GY855_14255 [candidate division Zixibacteria bacterium]|nr:hypothetical protein [candidate division Zixibacteria bacterium]